MRYGIWRPGALRAGVIEAATLGVALREFLDESRDGFILLIDVHPFGVDVRYVVLTGAGEFEPSDILRVVLQS